MEKVQFRLQALMSTTNAVATFVLSHFQSGKFEHSIKTDGSDVTNIDLEAELMAKELLLQAFPDDGFLGEEHDECGGSSEFRWIVDPIDGTTSFIRGVPLFGTQIGLEQGGNPIAGCVVMPAIDETIHAVIGEGVWHNNQPAAVSSTHALADALVCTTSFDYYKRTSSVERFHQLLNTEVSVRGWSDCYAFMLLCTGRVDGVVEPLLFPWDIIPWLPLIQESGGKFTSIGQGGLATNQKLHDSLYDVLNANITN